MTDISAPPPARAPRHLPFGPLLQSTFNQLKDQVNAKADINAKLDSYKYYDNVSSTHICERHVSSRNDIR